MTFEELWVISEQNIRQIDFERKKDTNKFLGKIISCTEKYIAHDVNAEEKKSYTVICQGKNF